MGPAATAMEVLTQGHISMGKFRFSEAEQCFRKTLALDPRSAAALVGLGRLALIRQQRAEALALLDRALSIDPYHPEALAVQGIAYMQVKASDRAVEVLEKARAASPDLQMVHFNLGKCYFELRQFAAAETFLCQAIRLNPKHFAAFLQLGLVQIQTGKIADGIHFIEKAIKANPHYLKGYLTLGSLHEKAGRKEMAIRLYKEGLRHNPNAFALRKRLCALYARKRDVRSAYAEAIEIVKRRNNIAEDFIRLGTYAAALRQYATAQRAFQTSIGLKPGGWEGHCCLAKLYVRAHKFGEAKRHYQASIENSCGSYMPFNEMGLFVLETERNCDGAIPFLEHAMQLAPSRPEPRLNLALAHARKRDYSVAEKCASSVLNLSPPGSRVYQEAARLRATIAYRNLGARLHSDRLRSSI